MLLLANTIGLVHILVVIWLTIGLPLSWLRPRVVPYYGATLALTIVSRLVYGGCPLTIWQETLKHRPDVEPLLASAFTIEVPPLWVGLGLSSGETLLLLIAALVLSLVFARLRRARATHS